jgi:tetratricopeptide (TPR) repeat protein
MPPQTNNLMELFQQGKEAIETYKFEQAKVLYERITDIDPACVEAWNNLGLALCELDQYRKSVDAYSNINDEQKTDKTWYNIALAYYYTRDYDQALNCIERIFQMDAYNSVALDLKAKIYLEQEDYQKAMISFNQAFSSNGDILYLLWEAYALHLYSEFSNDINEKAQRRLLNTLIGRLERLETLAVKHKRKAMREQTLYYLGCAYSRYKDYSTAIKKLEDCLQYNTKSEVARAARNLLEQSWNQLRPPFWRWWLQSPLFLNRFMRMGVFIFTFILLSLIIIILLLHPFSHFLHSSLKLEADWGVFLFVAGLLLILLLSPSIEQIKTKDVELTMHASPPADPFPPPAMMEGYIGSMSNNRRTNRGK